jgi:hypothetical protein
MDRLYSDSPAYNIAEGLVQAPTIVELKVGGQPNHQLRHSAIASPQICCQRLSVVSQIDGSLVKSYEGQTVA